MACVLQIGAGGVGGVVAHKMAMNRAESGGVFSRIILASRTLSKCKAIADSIRAKGFGEIEIDEVDADNVESVVALIEKYRPKLVVNVALPYQDLAIMEACLRTKTHYLDTANYEHPDNAHFEYKEQWAYDTRYKEAGIFALLGSGFDPGVTNVFCAYAQKHYFDEIHSIDILDCNAGDHGYAFATNFNPEINLREVSSKARYWVSSPSLAEGDRGWVDSTSLQSNLELNPDLSEDKIYRKFEREEKHWEAEVRGKENARLQGLEKNSAEVSCGKFVGCEATSEENKTDSLLTKRVANSREIPQETTRLQNVPYFNGQWRDVAPLALMKEWDYLDVGVKNSYLLYHEELESLIRNIKGLRKIRFFMTFGESYLTHMKCLENVGLLRIDEVAHKGGKIVPIEVLKTLLPDPASLAPRTKGQTHIGCYIKGLKDGKERVIYIYNICTHEECYAEVGAQGVSYTTGVPAMIGAKLICEGKWGVNCEKNSPFDSVESVSKLNADMPKGGESQGLDSNQGAGVWNMEQNDPDPFMSELNKQGLPYVVVEFDENGSHKVLEDGRKK